METEVIAEIGENHIGDIEIGLDLIRIAAQCGVTTVKFQSYNMDCIRKDDLEREWFREVMLSDEDHFELLQECEKVGVKFLSSPFSKERVDFLVDKCGCRELKIASAMFYDDEFLDYVANKQGVRKIYLSTGLASLHEVEKKFYRMYRKVKEIVLLHCISLYPCPIEHVNLNRINIFKQMFGFLSDYGWSDHVDGVDAAVAAVVLGVSVIEKHFTFDKKCPKGTDHILSADALEMTDMIEKIRKVEKFFGVRKWNLEMTKARKMFDDGRFII